MSSLQDLNRRQFVVLAAGCAAACACGDIAFAQDAVKTVDIGPVTDFPKDGIYDQFIKKDKLIVYRESGQIYASTAICPHRGARMVVKEDQVYCPKHGSTFSPAGTVVKGPAEDSLVRYAIALDDQKHMVVDTSKSFREKQWDDAASFVKIS
jgi:nitrite reductase/ring-hydroxylating ferredoxin subunit